jgi:hypothetical protein
MGAPYPRFPVEPGGFHELPAAFLNESRTRGYWWSLEQEIGYLARFSRDVGNATLYP